MNDVFPLPNIPGYVDIRQAARTLGVAESSVYRYIQLGQLSAYRAGRNIMVEEETLKQFKPNIAGRPRKKSSPWRISPDTSSFLVTYIRVNIQKSQLEELKNILSKIKQEERHQFSGTVTRYISVNNTLPVSVTIQLVWKSSDIPSKATQEKEFTFFKEDLADVLDWNTAEYIEGTALIHT